MAVDITPLLEAGSIAVIGASADPGKIGGRPIEYLKRLGYAGRIVPVNPSRDEVQGLTCLPSIAAAGEIDLAIIAAPASGAAAAIHASLAAGVKGMILFTAGYAEIGHVGAAEQAVLAAAVSDAGAVLLGPNCLGTLNVHACLAATFTTALEQLEPEAGGFSYFGQSGALGAYWIDMAARAKLGIAKWITTGNEAQVTGADALAYLAADTETRIVGAYLEDIKDPVRFAESAAVAARSGKRILAIKSGRSAAGRSAAAAHTGSVVGDDGWYAGFFQECGITRVSSLSEMIDTARILSSEIATVAGKRLGVVTVSGAAGVLICDAAARAGLRIPMFPTKLKAELASFLPGFARPQNPVDVTGAVVSDRALMERTLTTVAQSGACDTVLVFLGAMGSIADTLVTAIASARLIGTPIVVIWMAPPPAARAAIEALGVPVFAEIADAVVAIARALPRG